ncbi:hypothetical protein ACFSUK_27110 [Sphingobium scionense]|nr:hypothetical protein [Sphingomonas sp. BE138]
MARSAKLQPLGNDAATAKSRLYGVTIEAVEYGEIVSHPSAE